MTRIVPYIFILFFGSVSSQDKGYAQIEIDSFIINELKFQNIDELKKMLLSNQSLQGWSKYYALLCNDFRKKAMNDSTFFYGQKAIDFYNNSKTKNPLDEESLLSVYFNFGLVDYVEHENESSIKHLQKALDIEKKYPYKYKSYIRGYLAGNHLEMGNNELALKYYHANLKDTIYTALPQPYVVTLTRVATLYTPEYLDQRDSALFYFKKAIDEAPNYKANLPIIYGTLADLYRKNSKDSTLYYYRLSKKAFENYSVEKNISPSNINYFQIVNDSYVHIYDGKLKTSIKDLTKVIDSLSLNKINKSDRDILTKAFDYLALAYEKSDNLKKANALLRQKNEFENTFHKAELEQKLARLELDYETVKKEEEIRKLKAEADTKNTIAQQQKLLLLGGVGTLSLLLVIGALAYHQNNLKNKYVKVSLQQRLLRSQMNPHFLFNALNTAQILISKKSVEAEKYILNLAKLLRLTLENSREDFVPLINEVTALESYLNLQSNFSKKFDFYIEVDSDIESEWIQIPPMLLQPIVENSIIHGISNIDYRGTIHILMKKENNNIACTITDNGKGLPQELKKPKIYKEHKSISSDIVRERLAIFHNKSRKSSLLSISSNNSTNGGQTGTTVNFYIPYQSY